MSGVINSQEDDRIMSSIFQNFSKGNTVLFVGKGAEEADLTKELCELPWNCIVTDRTEEGFGAKFVTDLRRPKEYCDVTELPSNLFNRQELAIVRLYGVDGQANELDDDDLELEEMRRTARCQDMLFIVMRKLDILGCMIVVGYDLSISGTLPRTIMNLAWEQCQGSLIFTGMSLSDEKTDKMRISAMKRGYDWCSTSLADLLGKYRKEEISIADDTEKAKMPDNSLALGVASFYMDGEIVQISSDIPLRYRSLAELLTNERVYQIRPYGRIQQSRWFFHFLTRSSVDGPQWYGYLPQSEFYLKRGYEQILVALIHNILSGREMADQGYCTPVILEGDPGSSKSVILGALAYRIFTEKEFPVIFIHNMEFNHQDLEELDQMMQSIVPKGKSQSKVLLIWDGSAYYNITKTALEIARYLDNNGRRFVLVCSSYRNTGIAEDKTSDKIWYKKGKDDNFFPCEETDADVILKRSCYFVEACRELTTSEKVQLKQKVKEYSGKNTETLTEIWQRLDRENINSSFEYFYDLVVLLQPKLEQGLSREQRKVSRYVQEQLDRMRSEIGIETEKQPSQIALLLIKAGIFSTELEQELEAEEKKEEEHDNCDLTRFNIGVALFSRFKLEAPSSMMFWLLFADAHWRERDVYSYENRKLYAEITTAIPWILYRENPEGGYYFSYRNTLEAEIFLKKNQVDPDKQVELVCDMLEYFAQEFEQCGRTEDQAMKYQLQRLLRVLGPNSDYVQFQNQDDLEHNNILRLFDRIIEKLKWLRTEIKIPDIDASFAIMEVTFTREYYSSLWIRLNEGSDSGLGFHLSERYPEKFSEKAYLERLERLKNASDLANASIEKLEFLDTDNAMKRQIASQINSLTVEFVYCNMKYEELWTEYQALYKYSSSPDLKCEESLEVEDKGNKRKEGEIVRNISEHRNPIPYLTQYRMLSKAINSDPLNGYAYNALFSLFEKEYELSGEERKLQLLSEIQMMVEDAENLDIHNRGALDRDELGDHIAKIVSFRDETNVTIQGILDGTCSSVFYRLFQNMLTDNSPAAIMFVCQKELDRVGLNGKNLYRNVADITGNGGYEEKDLDEGQLLVCEKVRSFMKKREYSECIEKDPHALYLLLRVSWMCYNRRPLVDSGECRLTYIQQEKWKDILWICQMYEECAGKNKRPLAVLIHALAIVQVQRDYVEANALLEALGRNAFFASPRLRVPYMICDPTGIPKTYNGTIISVKDYRGFMRVEGVPLELGSKTGVRFFNRNLSLSRQPENRDVIKNMEMGIGYTGFSLYTKEGRERRMEERR